MATFTKFNDFVEQIGLEGHNLSADLIKVSLTATLPVVTQTDWDGVTDHDEPTNQNGYTAGGADIQNAWSEAPAGTGAMTATNVVWTADATPGVGPFRYVVMYNTTTGATDNLIGWYDYGSEITINDTETFTVNFGATVLTLT